MKKFRLIKISVIAFLFVSELSFSQTGCTDGFDGIHIPPPCPTPTHYDVGDWKLLFEDNFDGTSLDLTKWNPQTGVVRDPHHNNETEWYTPNNITVANGILKLEAKNEVLTNQCFSIWEDNGYNTYCQNFNYTSAEIDSKFKFGYGKYEIRCKIPYGIGTWPAFWTFGGNSSGSTSEIDCFEFTGGAVYHQLTNIHAAPGTFCGENYDEGTDFAGDFHTFSVIWSRDGYIEWYLSDANPYLIRRIDKYPPMNPYEFWLITGQDLPDPAPCFLQPAFPLDGIKMNIIANLAVENIVDQTYFPCALEIDYIRYYERRDCLDNANIWSGDHIPLAPDVYNCYDGNNITVGDISINNAEQLKLAACNEIAFVDGFSSILGSTFEGVIDSRVCCTPSGRFASPGSRDSSKIKNTKNSFLLENSNKNIAAENIVIVPNPNNGTFRIEGLNNESRNSKVEILGGLGEKVLEMNLENGNLIDISSLPKGLYMLKISSKDNTYIRKVLYY